MKCSHLCGPLPRHVDHISVLLAQALQALDLSSSTGGMDCRTLAVPDGGLGNYSAGALEISGWPTECSRK